MIDTGTAIIIGAVVVIILLWVFLPRENVRENIRREIWTDTHNGKDYPGFTEIDLNDATWTQEEVNAPPPEREPAQGPGTPPAPINCPELGMFRGDKRQGEQVIPLDWNDPYRKT